MPIVNYADALPRAYTEDTLLADDGPRNAGPSTTDEATDVTLREFVMAQLHALDVRITEQFHQRMNQVDERFETNNVNRDAQIQFISTRFDDRLTATRELATQGDLMQQRAIDKVDAANEKRFENMNEFRAQARDRDNNYATRVEMEARLSAITDRQDRTDKANVELLRPLQAHDNNAAGRTAILSVVSSAMVSIFIAVIIGLILRFMKA